MSFKKGPKDPLILLELGEGRSAFLYEAGKILDCQSKSSADYRFDM